MPSMFDADAFLNTESTGALSTKNIPVPEGDYLGTIERVSAREFTNSDGIPMHFLDVGWLIDDPNGTIEAITKRKKNTITQGIQLDLKPIKGGGLVIDYSDGANVRLGKLRAAVGQNNAEKSWSPMMLMGQRANVVVGSRTEKDTGDVYATIRRVGAVEQ